MASLCLFEYIGATTRSSGRDRAESFRLRACGLENQTDRTATTNIQDGGHGLSKLLYRVLQTAAGARRTWDRRNHSDVIMTDTCLTPWTHSGQLPIAIILGIK